MHDMIDDDLTTEPDAERDQQSADGLTPRQERAIGFLLVEPSIARAATAAGVGERTLHRWLDDPPFARAYRAARRRAFEQAVAMTHRYATLAVQSLARIIADNAAPASARVAAATSVLRFAREGIELDDILERVESLEAAARTREEAAP